ncbi:aldehyde dehydrogenase family protein [Steroidobacter sp. S1-65]|uniref:Aldehyde dehydrogenase family protein n=1 Tax=Steroidobacter gossypii TaxID=2805490 RepID=A0ABS1X6Q5_9GAMM|nr:aldehyde dehydrogenase family protein [Steroidobacter gossypii]MBM0108902.1 aldehyde dehydrogenase family protein [Steroidobacter gossypii]
MNCVLHKPDEMVAPFVDGKILESQSASAIEVINPSNGQSLLMIQAGCDADVDHAVTSARRAFDDGRWGEEPPSFRKKIMHLLADFIERDSSELDALDAGEMGKPIRELRANAASAAQLMRFYAEALDKVTGDVYDSDAGSFVAQRRVPRGVVAAIVPWNFPTFNAVLKLAPALAAGNCVVMKPSELSSRSSIRLAFLALRAGLPPGVLNVVPGLGRTVGRALALHRQVDMVSFTGSTAVGKQMLQYAGQSNLKVVLAECGGKSAQIVFDDGVDLDAASESIASLLLTNQGQLCSVGSRLLVQRSIEGALVNKIVARVKQVVMGDALDPNTTFGPLASAAQCARVMQYIEGAPDEGARLVAGGCRTLLHTGGYFVEPTVFCNVSPTARIAQEEIFGPVLSVIPFENEAEAIRVANGTLYGLAAYVWTANLSTAMRLTKALRSSVWVYAAASRGVGAGHAASFEPWGQSGLGVEGGLAGLESYQRRQLVWITHG